MGLPFISWWIKIKLAIVSLWPICTNGTRSISWTHLMIQEFKAYFVILSKFNSHRIICLLMLNCKNHLFLYILYLKSNKQRAFITLNYYNITKSFCLLKWFLKFVRCFCSAITLNLSRITGCCLFSSHDFVLFRSPYVPLCYLWKQTFVVAYHYHADKSNTRINMSMNWNIYCSFLSHKVSIWIVLLALFIYAFDILLILS